MALRGTKPKPKSDRLKLMMFSPAGVGKTTAAIQMPKPYVIDAEGGTSHYGAIIEKAGGAVFHCADIEDAIKEVKELATTSHDFRTVIIDPITTMYEAKQDEGATNPKIGDQYGKHTAYANRYVAKLFRLLSEVDMNVVVTSHAKDLWLNGERMGVTFDGWKKLDYVFDLVIELQRRGKKRAGIIRKTRLESFPDQETFDWSFEALQERWGSDSLTREAVAVEMATDAQVSALIKKVAALNISDTVTGKWLKAAGAESWNELTGEQITKAIKYCDNKLAEAGNGKDQ